MSQSNQDNAVATGAGAGGLVAYRYGWNAVISNPRTAFAWAFYTSPRTEVGAGDRPGIAGRHRIGQRRASGTEPQPSSSPSRVPPPMRWRSHLVLRLSAAVVFRALTRRAEIVEIDANKQLSVAGATQCFGWNFAEAGSCEWFLFALRLGRCIESVVVR